MQLQASSPEGYGPSQDLPTAAAVAMVLGNDDLLIDVLLRLDFPTWLVRAAAVCRRWLRHASDPDFLRRFRALHPPRILALQADGGGSPLRFLPVPHPPALAAAARRALETLSRSKFAIDCRNGRIIVETFGGFPVLSVRSLLHPTPDVPVHQHPCFSSVYLNLGGNGIDMLGGNDMFLLENDDASFLYLAMATNGETVNAMFSILQSGAWCAPHSAELDLKIITGERLGYPIVGGKKFVAGRKVYMLSAVASTGHMFGLDLVTSSFFTVKLPEGVGDYKLSRAQHSGLYLIDAMGFQLRIWYGDGLGQWVLEDTICVREACGHLNVQKWKPDGELAPILVVGVGDNAEFVFLKLVASGIVCCMQLGSRIVEKMEWTVPDVAQTVAISMVWPPVFPVLGEAANQEC